MAPGRHAYQRDLIAAAEHLGALRVTGAGQHHLDAAVDLLAVAYLAGRVADDDGDYPADSEGWR